MAPPTGRRRVHGDSLLRPSTHTHTPTSCSAAQRVAQPSTARHATPCPCMSGAPQPALPLHPRKRSERTHRRAPLQHGARDGVLLQQLVPISKGRADHRGLLPGAGRRQLLLALRTALGRHRPRADGPAPPPERTGWCGGSGRSPLAFAAEEREELEEGAAQARCGPRVRTRRRATGGVVVRVPAAQPLRPRRSGEVRAACGAGATGATGANERSQWQRSKAEGGRGAHTAADAVSFAEERGRGGIVGASTARGGKPKTSQHNLRHPVWADEHRRTMHHVLSFSPRPAKSGTNSPPVYHAGAAPKPAALPCPLPALPHACAPPKRDVHSTALHRKPQHPRTRPRHAAEARRRRGCSSSTCEATRAGLQRLHCAAAAAA